MASLLLLVAFCSSAMANDGTTNLVQNGGFEEADLADTNKPAFWDRLDGLGVQWVNVPADDGGAGRGKVIRMDTRISEADMVAQWKKVGITKWDIPKPAKDPVAATYGLSYYSDSMPVLSGQAYRVSFNFKGAGGAKVWVRGYGKMGPTHRKRLFEDPLGRRLYETIVNCTLGGKDWTAYSRCFHPTTNTPTVTSMKVMLFSYWPPGIYWFDDLAITPVSNEVWRADMKEE